MASEDQRLEAADRDWRTSMDPMEGPPLKVTEAIEALEWHEQRLKEAARMAPLHHRIGGRGVYAESYRHQDPQVHAPGPGTTTSRTLDLPVDRAAKETLEALVQTYGPGVVSALAYLSHVSLILRENVVRKARARLDMESDR